MLWEVVDDHVLEDKTDHDEIGLRGFYFNLFDKDEKGVGREGSSEFPYLLMLMKLWHVDWKTKSKRVNLKVDEDNGNQMGIGNIWYRKVCHFQAMNFGRTLVVSFQLLPLVLGGRSWGTRKRK